MTVATTAPTVTIAVENPLTDDVRAMVAALNAYLIPLTPREFQFQLTAEQMAEPTVTVFVARDAGGLPSAWAQSRTTAAVSAR